MSSFSARMRLIGLPFAVLFALAACGGSSTPAPSAAAATSAASEAASQGTAGSPGGSSIGGVVVGGAADLEALLPSTACGQPTVKSSFSSTGAVPGASANPLLGALGALSGAGKAAIAIAEPSSPDTCKVSFLAYQVAGSNQTFFQAMLTALAAQSGGGAQSTVGGKSVIKLPDTDTTTYLYIKGDTIFAVTAPDDNAAAPGLAALP